MIVVDASALLEALLQTPAGQAVEDRLFAPRRTLYAPHLLEVEVAQVDAPLLTRDRRLATAAGHRARIELV